MSQNKIIDARVYYIYHSYNQKLTCMRNLHRSGILMKHILHLHMYTAVLLQCVNRTTFRSVMTHTQTHTAENKRVATVRTYCCVGDQTTKCFGGLLKLSQTHLQCHDCLIFLMSVIPYKFHFQPSIYTGSILGLLQSLSSLVFVLPLPTLPIVCA